MLQVALIVFGSRRSGELVSGGSIGVEGVVLEDDGVNRKPTPRTAGW